jgi:hypothetical protein
LVRWTKPAGIVLYRSFSRHREGFLLKKGDWIGVWRRRYFRLSKGTLAYYRNDTDDRPAAIIKMNEIEDIIEEDNQKSYSFRIELTSGSKIHLCGIGHHDSAKWIQDIRHEINENHEKQNKQEYDIISIGSFEERKSELNFEYSEIQFKIAIEEGLSNQNYKCFQCQSPCGIIYGPALVCNFNGKYYCSKCHNNDKSVIPSRLIFNWDFSMRPISKRAREYLSQIQHDPIINLEILNSIIYRHVPALDRVKNSRNKLQKMEPYLITCEEGSEIFNYYMHGRKYLCNDLDLYSITDLVEFKEETLEGTIKTCLTLGRKHIYNCQRCKMKGFYCELCSCDKLIFPFETDETVICPACFTCFHKSCYSTAASISDSDSVTPTKCPKCKRRKIRQEKLQLSDSS